MDILGRWIDLCHVILQYLTCENKNKFMKHFNKIFRYLNYTVYFNIYWETREMEKFVLDYIL